MKVFLHDLKQTLADNAKVVVNKPQSGPSATDEGRAPITTPVRVLRKGTPTSAPPARKKKKKSMVECWEETKVAALTKRSFDPNFPVYDHRSILGFENWYLKAMSVPYQR